MYSADLRKHYMLDNPSWKRDIMPEIIEGKNVLDYVDPEIEAKLEALEMEEEALAAAAAIEVSLSTVWHSACALDAWNKPKCRDAEMSTLQTTVSCFLVGFPISLHAVVRLSVLQHYHGVGVWVNAHAKAQHALTAEWMTVCCLHPFGTSLLMQ